MMCSLKDVWFSITGTHKVWVQYMVSIRDTIHTNFKTPDITVLAILVFVEGPLPSTSMVHISMGWEGKVSRQLVTNLPYKKVCGLPKATVFPSIVQVITVK